MRRQSVGDAKRCSAQDRWSALSRDDDHRNGEIDLAAPAFALDVVPDRERVLVRPVGEVDIATAGQLERSTIELFGRGFSRVVVDLRGVTFLDSSGVHTLIKCHETAADLGASMSIIPGGPASRRVLDIAGVMDRFEIER
jgi:anti-anti-sigma factor